jgi:hypothetical protein
LLIHDNDFTLTAVEDHPFKHVIRPLEANGKKYRYFSLPELKDARYNEDAAAARCRFSISVRYRVISLFRMLKAIS